LIGKFPGGPVAGKDLADRGGVRAGIRASNGPAKAAASACPSEGPPFFDFYLPLREGPPRSLDFFPGPNAPERFPLRFPSPAHGVIVPCFHLLRANPSPLRNFLPGDVFSTQPSMGFALGCDGRHR